MDTVTQTPVKTGLHIDGTRLWDSLMSLAQLGATPAGGVCRLALTDLDKQGRERVIGWLKAAGCTVRVDQIGNIFARRAGQDNSLAPVAAGSHIDTQPTGGKFDGNYGVLSVLEVIRTLNDHKIETLRPIDLVIWTNEEGSRFVPVMMGSGVYADVFSLETALAAVDRDGVSVGQALKDIGYDGSEPASLSKGAKPFYCYFESHIEQGPVLEDENMLIGAVTGALGQRWYDVTVTGMEAHAGPTPIALRRDAMQAAAKIMLEVVAAAARQGPQARGTVGYVNVHPNSRNVIPGKVTFTIDFRNTDDAGLAVMDAEIRAFCVKVAGDTQTQVQIEQVVTMPSAAFDEQLIGDVSASAQARGYATMRIPSGAGHDAVFVSRHFPVGMVFIPCKGGVSHNESESILPEHAEYGGNVMLDVILAAAMRG